MKIVIMAGGQGSRLAEETRVRPKPMVEIGGMPILQHIMMHYSHYGLNDFIIGLGYKGEFIKKYFSDYSMLHGNLTIKLGNGNNRTEQHRQQDQHAPWTIDLIETGLDTQTGGRMKQLRPYIGDKTFMYTLGDGISNVDINKLLAFHKSHGKLATVTAVQPPSRYGYLVLNGEEVTRFEEKPLRSNDLINGAFMVLEPQVFDYIDEEDSMFEGAAMERLALDGQLMAYKHDNFWACMDTLRDKIRLQEMWDLGDRPWAVWEH